MTDANEFPVQSKPHITITTTMPRTLGKAQALKDIGTEVEGIAYAYVLASSSAEDDDYEEDIEDLLVTQEVIISDRYLFSRDSARTT